MLSPLSVTAPFKKMGALILRANVGLAFYVDKGLIEPESDLILVRKDYTP